MNFSFDTGIIKENGVFKVIDVLELAKYFLYLSERDAQQAGDEAVSDMNPMKLQKLLYYCQCYSLGFTGQPLFGDPIEAWQYGPIVRRVYKEYQEYKGKYFPLDLVESPPNIDDYSSAVARLVMRDKGKFSAIALMKMTHQENAWRESWRKIKDVYAHNHLVGEVLSIETMRRDFETALTEEMLEEEKEDELWSSLGREPTEEEWKEIAFAI
jgi:uncharacterized phage-associated protein